MINIVIKTLNREHKNKCIFKNEFLTKRQMRGGIYGMLGRTYAGGSADIITVYDPYHSCYTAHAQ